MKRPAPKKRIASAVDEEASEPPSMPEDEALEGASVGGSGFGAKLSAKKKKIMKPRGILKVAHADPWDA